MTKVFIDGDAGTTGLRIHSRLAQRPDITLISLPDSLRKDPAARREALHSADIAFLCLPDAAARDAVALAEGSAVRIIDTSTAHRTAEGWVYGFPELVGREAVAEARLVANPGCHASGFIALAAPLVRAGLLPPDAALSCTSLTGYSGGGKKMIAEYEAPGRSPLLEAPRLYALPQAHKHLPEMAALCGLRTPPVFCPVVAPFHSGMAVTVPLHRQEVKASPAEILALYRNTYRTGLVHAADLQGEGFLSACALAGRDDMLVTVTGSGERMVLTALFDNLGKGACGAAIENMNLMLGLPESTGLNDGGDTL